MQTTFLLIRHGDTDWVGRAFAGRMPGVSINAAGRGQAAALAERLDGLAISAIYSSPLERALETAAPLAARRGLPVVERERLVEIGTGDWTGAVFDNLKDDPQWRRFLSFRSSTRIPGGESMLDVQARMVAEMEELRARHPGETLALFSHADVIRFTIAHYAGIPTDLAHRLEIRPGSVSVAAIGDGDARILRLNDAGRLASVAPSRGVEA